MTNGQTQSSDQTVEEVGNEENPEGYASLSGGHRPTGNHRGSPLRVGLSPDNA